MGYPLPAREGYLPAIAPQRTLYTNFYSPYVVRREGTVFTGVSLFMWGDTPSPLHNISTGPMSFLEGTPTLHPIILPLIPCPLWGSTLSESHNTSTGPRSLSHPGVPPDQGWVTPPPRDSTAEPAIATRRPVCLLRSRRRTFLLIDWISSWKSQNRWSKLSILLLFRYHTLRIYGWDFHGYCIY